MCDLLVNLKMNDFYMEFGVQNVKEPVISLFLKWINKLRVSLLVIIGFNSVEWMVRMYFIPVAQTWSPCQLKWTGLNLKTRDFWMEFGVLQTEFCFQSGFSRWKHHSAGIPVRDLCRSLRWKPHLRPSSAPVDSARIRFLQVLDSQPFSLPSRLVSVCVCRLNARGSPGQGLT